MGDLSSVRVGAVRGAGSLLCAVTLCACLLARVGDAQKPPAAPPPGWKVRSEFFNPNTDGSYQFGYSTGDVGQHYHSASATPDNTVTGVFGRRDPVTGRDQQTQYTAGGRGFRPRGPNIARRYDLSQTKLPYNPPVPQDSPNYNPTYDTYHDPNEDPSYQFGFRSGVYDRREQADARGHVDGRYTFVDDVGLSHVVEYVAGARTGYHVKTPYPESNAIGGLFFHGPLASKTGKATRGHTAVQRYLDGAYRFTAVGPDQRREEQSDAAGNVKGSFTYVDDKGVQRTTQYIAGPNIGYKVVKSQLNAQAGAASAFVPPAPSAFVPPAPSAPLAPPFGGDAEAPALSTDDDVFDLPEGLKTAATASAVVAPPDQFLGGGGDDEDVFGAAPAQDDGSPTPASTPSLNGSGNDDDDDDIFGAKDGADLQPPPGLSPTAPAQNIPYTNCCELSSRGQARFASRQAGRFSPRTAATAGDDGGRFTGFPAGVAVRGRVQSLDVPRRQLPPGETLA